MRQVRNLFNSSIHKRETTRGYIVLGDNKRLGLSTAEEEVHALLSPIIKKNEKKKYSTQKCIHKQASRPGPPTRRERNTEREGGDEEQANKKN